MLKYGAIEKRKTIQLFSGDDLTTENADVKIVVELVSRAEFREWIYAHDTIRAKNRAALRRLEAESPGDYAADYLTKESSDATAELMRTAIKRALVSIEGVDVAGCRSADYSDPSKLEEILEHTQLTGHVFAAILRAQAPTPRESLFSGS